MCGIAGNFAYAGLAPPVERDELLRVRDAMLTRGPDGEGLWIAADKRVGLAHRRLSIIDLSQAGSQPMFTPDGRLAVTFNGEIYNYRSLRTELEAKGYVFRSESDTEVLLHLYADRGVDMVHALRGMYAFGIWDAREQALFLARDPFGIKPLYYADDGNTLRFASQVKALLRGGAVDTAPEPAGAAGFMLWGFVPEPFTLYRGIVSLPAGAHLVLRRDGAAQVSTFFSPRDELLRAQSEPRAFRASDRGALADLLRDSVRHHLVSDVPVGVFLSAGVDSTLITCLAAEQSEVSLRSLTLGFEQFVGTASDEVPLAEATAKVLGTRHETHWIGREDFAGERDSIVAAMDQPTTDGVNTYLICREAARAGIKVALSGVGGDELFGGYPSFRDVPRMAAWLRPATLISTAGKLARVALTPLLPRSVSPKYAGLLEYGGTYEGAYMLRRALLMPWELRQVLDPVAVHVGLERLRTLPVLAALFQGLDSPKARVSALELQWYMKNQLLRDADWAGMAHSLEVRVPLVDAHLFRALAPWLVASRPPGKADAAAAAEKVVRREILGRPKSGFAVPLRDWLVAEEPRDKRSGRGLREWARKVMPSQPRQFRALVLVTDAFGGHGGIAKFNRDMVTAISAMPECAEVVVIPRLVPAPMEPLPPRVKFLHRAAGGKTRFVRIVLSRALSGPIDIVFAGHLNLAPVARWVAWRKSAKALLTIYGVDAWEPHRSWLVRGSLRAMSHILTISRITQHRFNAWARMEERRFHLLPPTVDLSLFTPGPKPKDLEKELGLEGRRIVMTFGRLATKERYKGFDEVIEALPALVARVPDIAYLICGDGSDRQRLEAKVAELGVGHLVRFAGFVEEERKPAYYRLADAYVMPSSGEGFGIVLLEAMASGVPALASTNDGGREALMDGALGELVDPRDAASVLEGILRTLARSKHIPEDLREFSETNFRHRTAEIVRHALAAQRP